MYSYIKEHEEFYLVDEQGELLSHKGEKVLGIAISVDAETNVFCLHKHGGYDWVKKWFEETCEKYRKAGLSDIAQEMRLIRVENCLLEDLNRILSTSALSVKFIEKLQTIDIVPQ